MFDGTHKFVGNSFVALSINYSVSRGLQKIKGTIMVGGGAVERPGGEAMSSKGPWGRWIALPLSNLLHGPGLSQSAAMVSQANQPHRA